MSIYDILLDYDEKAFEVKKSYDYAGGNIVNSHNLLANKTFGGRKAKLFTVIDFCTLPFFSKLVKLCHEFIEACKFSFMFLLHKKWCLEKMGREIFSETRWQLFHCVSAENHRKQLDYGCHQSHPSLLFVKILDDLLWYTVRYRWIYRASRKK